MKSNVTHVKPPLIRAYFLPVVFFISFILSNPVAAQRQHLIIESPWEGTTPFTGWQVGWQSCCTYSINQSSEQARTGTKSLKYDLRSSDPIVSGSVRSEIQPTGAGDNTPAESERWYGLSYYLVNYGADNGAESILQWHDVDGTCPPLSLQVQGGRLRIQQCISNSNTSNDIGPVVSNQWFDIVIHVKWTVGNSGILEVWKDGVKVVNKSNIRTNSSGGSYLKLGINKWSWAPGGGSSSQTERIFFIDEFRMGDELATYNDVEPGDGATPPPPTNQPPTVNGGNNATITLPTNFTTLNATGTDPEGTALTYRWTWVSGPTAYTLGTAGAATTTLTGLIQGTYTFRVTATDGGGATATDDVTVTVNPAAPPPNQPPVARAGADQGITLPLALITLDGSASTDPEGGALSYKWTKINGPGTFTISTPLVSLTLVTGLVAGTYTFQLAVTDNGGLTATDNVVITVNPLIPPPNQAPTANAGNNVSITLPVDYTTLTGTGTDPEGGALTYKWTRVNGPTTYTFGNANAASTSLTGLVQGTYTFRLTVTDNATATGTDDVTVTVNPAVTPPPVNQPPTANAGNNITITLPTNSTTLTGTGTDPEGGTLAYKWTWINGPASYTFGSSVAASTSLTGLAQGTYTFRLTVTDNGNATATDDISVTVNPAAPPPNQPPVADAGNNIVMTLPTNSTTLNGSASSDPDGTITYRWTWVSGPTTYTIASVTAANTLLTGLVQGAYIFRLTVTDNNNATATDVVAVTVNPAAPPPPPPPPSNQLPVANAGTDVILYLPVNSTTLYGTGSTDPDGLIAGYEWTELSGPSQLSITSRISSSLALSNLMMGEYSFQLKVTDNKGASSTTTVKVTVKTRNNEELYCNIFPNPTRSTLKIQYIANTTGKVTLNIYDVNKRFIMGETIPKDQVVLTKTIDISKFRSGTYFLELVVAGNRMVVKKVIKL